MSRVTSPERDRAGTAAGGFHPVVLVLRATQRFAPNLTPRLQKSIVRGIYQVLNSPKYLGDRTFMNYGFAPLNEGDTPPVDDLVGEEEDRRLSIQLYAKIAATVDLAGKDLLEVGCGPGGGSSYLHRARSTRTATALDLAPRAVTAAGKRYGRAAVRYLAADAERLPFPSGSFDVVINVESSHCYPDIATFFAEVARVLRPGGFFLIADVRAAKDIDTLRQQLAATGLVVQEEERITANVLRALELDSAQRRALIQQNIPFGLRQFGRNFMAAEGSPTFEQFRSRKLEYLRFVLQKP